MEAVLVALIGFAGVVLAAWLPIRRLRQQNTDQHLEARGLQQAIYEKVESVDRKLDEHIGWHRGRGDRLGEETGRPRGW